MNLLIEYMKITKSKEIVQATTRTIYPGEHYLEIQINGKKFGKKYFEVI